MHGVGQRYLKGWLSSCPNKVSVFFTVLNCKCDGVHTLERTGVATNNHCLQNLTAFAFGIETNDAIRMEHEKVI